MAEELQIIGTVDAVTGEAFARGESGTRTLEPGSPLYAGDELVTGDGGNIEVHFADDTLLSQGANSSIALDDYVYDTDTSTGELLFNMTTGTFRMVTGEIAKQNPERFKVGTPLTTIGIRGTTTVHEIPPDGDEKHGVEEIHGHRAMIVQSKISGEIRQIFSPRSIVDVSILGALSPVRSFTVQEEQTFREIAPVNIEREEQLREDEDIVDEDQDDDGDEDTPEDQDDGQDEGGPHHPESAGDPNAGVTGGDPQALSKSADHDPKNVGGGDPRDDPGAISKLLGEEPDGDERDDNDGDDPLYKQEPIEQQKTLSSGDDDDDDLIDDGTDDDTGGGSDDDSGDDDTGSSSDGEYIVGTSAADTLEGSSGSDTIYGRCGNDLLEGKAGDDTLYGENDNDTLVGGSGDDTLDGGAGEDYAKYADATGSIFADLVAGTVSGGGTGLDTIIHIEGIDGSYYDDSFHGTSGTDFFEGMDGDDTLEGMAGSDVLTGGSGADKFKYSASGQGADSVVDFTSGTDKFTFNSSYYNTTNVKTASIGGYDGSNGSLGDNNEWFIFDQVENKLWYDSNGDLSGGEEYISHVTGNVVSGDVETY